MGLFDFLKRKPAQPEPAPQPSAQDKIDRKQYEDMMLYGINKTKAITPSKWR
jgi:hypothetical protein